MIVRIIEYSGCFNTAIATRDPLHIREYAKNSEYHSVKWGTWYGEHGRFPFGFDISEQIVKSYSDSISIGIVSAAAYSVFIGGKVEEYEVPENDLHGIRAAIIHQSYCSTGGTFQEEKRAYIVTNDQGMPIVERLPEYRIN